jgi:hypothetical protein
MAETKQSANLAPPTSWDHHLLTLWGGRTNEAGTCLI